MDIQELMKYERQKAIINAMAELEIALNTFYNNESFYDELNNIFIQLKEFKESYL